jgi:hypothetical protein
VLARSAALHPKQNKSITYEHRVLKTKELAAMNLDAKTPPKAIFWSSGLLADSTAGRCDLWNHTCFARTRAVVPAFGIPLSKKKNRASYT